MQLFPRSLARLVYGAFSGLAVLGVVLSPLQPALQVAAASLPAASQTQLRAPLFAPALTATKSDALFTDVDGDTLADPGDVLRYTVTMTNTGSEATGVVFSDTLDANATLVASSINVAPIAVTDVYTTVGNTLLVISNTAPAGPVVFLSGTAFSNDLEFLGDTFSLSSYAATSAQGGSVAMDAAGRFSYLPPVGFTGTDTFTYTLADGSAALDSATVTINVVSRVWYVQNTAAGGGTGRSNSPFNTLAAAQSASAANDTIYVLTGSGTTGQNAGFALKNGQRLLGQGVALTMPVSVDGVSPSVTLQPAGSAPQIGNAAGNGVTGVDV
ncbi:MAG: cadherin-like domain-containing protein, partial [Anaerolineales bacterium]|nr:cadherin-like domain-containing protein [Anaerolineales bacterium]